MGHKTDWPHHREYIWIWQQNQPLSAGVQRNPIYRLKHTPWKNFDRTPLLAQCTNPPPENLILQGTRLRCFLLYCFRKRHGQNPADTSIKLRLRGLFVVKPLLESCSKWSQAWIHFLIVLLPVLWWFWLGKAGPQIWRNIWWDSSHLSDSKCIWKCSGLPIPEWSRKGRSERLRGETEHSPSCQESSVLGKPSYCSVAHTETHSPSCNKLGSVNWRNKKKTNSKVIT